MKWIVWTSFGMFDNIAEPHEVEAETAEDAEEAYRRIQLEHGLGCEFICGIEKEEA